jgi:hypothetical protein
MVSGFRSAAAPGERVTHADRDQDAADEHGGNQYLHQPGDAAWRARADHPHWRGEVRVNRAVRSTTAAWDAETEAGSLSFGYHAAEAASEIGRRLIIRNFGARARTYGITAAFRYANDASSGAVTVNVPGSVRVAAGATKAVKVTLNIDPNEATDVEPEWGLVRAATARCSRALSSTAI